MSIAVKIEQPNATDLAVIHAFLSETYWSPGVPRDVVARAAANSICGIARDEKGALIGYARTVTDRASFAWLADVFVLPEHRGKGIARQLAQSLQSHPELIGLRRWLRRNPRRARCLRTTRFHAARGAGTNDGKVHRRALWQSDRVTRAT